MSTRSLVSAQTRVESPFIIVKIGDYTFGHCQAASEKAKMGSVFRIVYPNFVDSLNIVKVNGTVNTYTLKMTYQITETDDPNYLEKVLSSISTSRHIIISYGDWNAPAFIYREEEAIVTKVQSSVDFNNSRIVYTIKCTSVALALKAGTFSFGAKTAKPSDEILKLFKNKAYGLSEIFTAMSSESKILSNGFLATDDKSVRIEAKQNINILDYITYLVSCMVAQDDPGGSLKKSNYYWASYDDINNEYGGTYFRVVKVTANAQYNISYNTYEVDVGYPSGNFVTSFTMNSDDTWSILYNYSEKLERPQYSYTIDKSGNVVSMESPSLTSSAKYFKTTPSSKTWWTQMTQFPVTAKLTIKGLLRPAILMSYVKVNSYFYGHKHVSSGLYIITRQEDVIDSNGYKTMLSLTRVSGDTSYV